MSTPHKELLLAVLRDGQWHLLTDLEWVGLQPADFRKASWRRTKLLPRWVRLGMIEVQDGRARLITDVSRPAGNRSAMLEPLRAELADRQWHDLDRLIRKHALRVPPNEAVRVWRRTEEVRLRTRTSIDPDTVPLEERIRKGQRMRIRLALTQWANYGYVEMDPPGWHVHVPRRVRWINDHPRRTL